MPYYKDVNLLFIHIPKTGGTMIEYEIKRRYNQTLYSLYENTLLDPPYHKISLQHLFYTTLYQFKNRLNIDFNNIKIFSFVRNPYDRVISGLFWNKLINQDYTSEQVHDEIKYNFLYRDDLDNHNQPQYKYITDENSKLIKNIKIFKTETLNKSNDELNKFLGFYVNIKRDNVNKNYDRYLNKDSIALINDFYKKDFELFNYEFK